MFRLSQDIGSNTNHQVEALAIVQKQMIAECVIGHAKALTKTKSQENTTMNTEHVMENTQRQFLSKELRNSYLKHDNALEVKFFIREDTPATAEDALQRIKDGKYQVKDKKDRGCFDHWTHHVIWREPGQEKDAEGYKTASDKLRKDYEHAVQDVMILSLDKALASVRKFEDWTH